MSIVINRAGAEICFEIALAKMSDDLREYLEGLHLPSKQAFFTMYERLHERETNSVWNLSRPNGHLKAMPHDLRILAEAV